MSHASSTIMSERPQLSLLDRAATLSSWVLAAALFLTVGWFAMEPDDPLGPVSMLGRHGAPMMLIQAAALAGVVGGLATMIAGRRLADAGTFAAALGLAVVSLRGGTAECLLVQGADVSTSFERGLALKFALEAVGWLVVMCVALVVSVLVMRWCFKESDDPGPAPADAAPSRSRLSITPAGCDIPRFSSRWFGVPLDRQTPPADGVKHTIIATGVGLAAITLLSAGLSSRSIQHGQVCFVVAAAVGLGTYFAHRMAPVRSALWSILAVVLIALMGYVWAAVRPAVAGLPPSIPSSHFMRVLPIQYISIGTAAALAMFWYVYVPVFDKGSGDGNADRRPIPEGRR
ncbi:MAG: hypothetical protein WBE26_16460 [Phycisphaerae bacterium]